MVFHHELRKRYYSNAKFVPGHTVLYKRTVLLTWCSPIASPLMPTGAQTFKTHMGLICFDLMSKNKEKQLVFQHISRFSHENPMTFQKTLLIDVNLII